MFPSFILIPISHCFVETLETTYQTVKSVIFLYCRQHAMFAQLFSMSSESFSYIVLHLQKLSSHRCSNAEIDQLIHTMQPNESGLINFGEKLNLYLPEETEK